MMRDDANEDGGLHHQGGGGGWGGVSTGHRAVHRTVLCTFFVTLHLPFA